ncbi:Uncharacterised protein [Mycobacteroides abscessus subsp. abscessus]|nr:Uncharacterised protein [Mycobacteroides abscessus subsp. abscessus]
MTMSSSRFRNSGRKAWRTTPITELFFASGDMVGSARNCEPRLLVMIRIVLRKSTVRPWPSVSRPSSSTCNRMLNRSG